MYARERSDDDMNIETCVDCNAYDDTLQEDSFMMQFEDDLWLCGLCAEERSYDD